MSQVGRISGPLLFANLERNGVDLKFSNTSSSSPILKLDVTNNRVGIGTNSPISDLQVPESFNTSGFIGTGTINVADFTLANREISVASGDILINAGSTIEASAISTEDIKIEENNIYGILSNADLDFVPSTGYKVDIQSDLDVDENLHATGDITFEGDITFGSDADDDIVFAADVASDIMPDLDSTLDLGRKNDDDSTYQRYSNLYSQNITATRLETATSLIGGNDYTTATGNSFYVDINGDDGNAGNHPQSAFRTIKHALAAVDSSVGGMTTVNILAGVYVEDFPLEIPANTNVLGSGFREVIIKPSETTKSKDCFLMTGETTVGNLTIMDFFYDSGNDTGYGFRFANNAITTSRSPYVQNVSVITKGSVTSADDPRGFDEGDAGRGALVDGSALDTNSIQSSMLFHSVTFLTAGAIGLRMKDGVRVEWLNSFTYFADIGLKAENGATGFVSPHDGSTRNFGAELRSIGSACVYGNKGAVADGADALMYLIQHNMAYIGTGKDKSNDKTLRIEANETEELNNGNIYFQTTDALGKFKIGNAFFADFDKGTTSIDANNVAFDALSKITITSGQDETFIDGSVIDTGNLLLSGNKISSSTENLIFDPITKTEIRSNVTMKGTLDITGDISIGQTLTKIGDEEGDTVKFNMDFTQNIEPDIGGRFSLGTSAKRWREIYTSEANIDDVRIFDNQITTSVSNSDLEFAANGTGRIYIENNDVQADNNFQVDGTTTLPSLDITGTVTQTGNSNFNTNYNITGDLTVENITIPRDVALKQFDIRGNSIYGTVTNANMQLEAAGTGTINVPNNNVNITNNLTARDATTGAITFSNIIDASAVDTSNIEILTNVIRTTQSNSDLELRASGTGNVVVENFEFTDSNITNFTGDISLTPADNLNITSNTALQLPVGNVAQRRNTLGDIRFNSSNNVFEGYHTSVITLGGVYSDDQQTFINVDPQNNYIDFNVAGNNVGTINAIQVELPGLLVDDVFVNNSTITTTASNSNLELRPNGTGKVLINTSLNTELTSNLIKNTSSGALTFANTVNGYTKVDSTLGVRIPTGTDAERGSNNQVGDTRYNTDQEYMETWDGNIWTISAGGGGATISEEEMSDLMFQFSMTVG